MLQQSTKASDVYYILPAKEPSPYNITLIVTQCLVRGDQIYIHAKPTPPAVSPFFGSIKEVRFAVSKTEQGFPVAPILPKQLKAAADAGFTPLDGHWTRPFNPVIDQTEMLRITGLIPLSTIPTWGVNGHDMTTSIRSVSITFPLLYQ